MQAGSLAAAPSDAQYSGAGAPVPVSRSGTAVAQNYVPDDMNEAARNALKAELDRIRREAGSGGGVFDPPIPVRKKGAPPALASEAVVSEPVRQGARPADPQAGRLAGHLLILGFRGGSPSDSGPKAIRSLLQSGLIAGTFFTRENIQSKAQLKELMKFLWSGGSQNRPIFAIREIGGTSDALPPIKDFEQWPAEGEVASKGDPQYAYSTYRSLGSALSGLGFNVNFGPVLSAPGSLRDQASSFGANPLQTGVFAKTFLLGHREENVIAVPLTDGTDHSVRAMKTLLLADPRMPVAMNTADPSGAAALIVFERLVVGVKFCFQGPARGANPAGAVSAFAQGCDALVLDGGDNPIATREAVSLALSQAAAAGEISLSRLEASAQRMIELRSSSGPAARSE